MVVVKAGVATSVLLGTTSADQISGTYQFVPKGYINFYALSNGTGMLYTLLNNGQVIASLQPVPWFGTSGTMKKTDNIVLTQAVNPGRLELYFNNPTAGNLTVDYMVEHIQTK